MIRAGQAVLCSDVGQGKEGYRVEVGSRYHLGVEGLGEESEAASEVDMGDFFPKNICHALFARARPRDCICRQRCNEITVRVFETFKIGFAIRRNCNLRSTCEAQAVAPLISFDSSQLCRKGQ